MGLRAKVASTIPLSEFRRLASILGILEQPISSNHVFTGADRIAAIAARDAYFTANPSEQVTGVLILLVYGATSERQVWSSTAWVDIDMASLSPEDSAALDTLLNTVTNQVLVGDPNGLKNVDLSTNPAYLGTINTANSWRLSQDGVTLQFERYNATAGEYETIGSFGSSLITDEILLTNEPRAAISSINENGTSSNLIRSTSAVAGVDVGSVRGTSFITTSERVVKAEMQGDEVTVVIRANTDETRTNVSTHSYLHTSPLEINGDPKDAGVTESFFLNITTADVRFNVKVFNDDTNELLYRAYTDAVFESGEGFLSVSGYNEYVLPRPYSVASGTNQRIELRFATPVTIVGGLYESIFIINWGAKGATIDFKEMGAWPAWKDGREYFDGLGQEQRSWIYENNRIYQLKLGESGEQTGTFNSNITKWELLGSQSRDDFNTPEITTFNIQNQSNMVDIGTVLSGLQTFNFTVTNLDNVAGDLTLAQDGTVLANNISKSTTSFDQIITSVTLNAGESTTFTLSLTDTRGDTVSRNFVVRARVQEEALYYGVANTNIADDIDEATLTEHDVTTGAQFNADFDIPNGDYAVILSPADREISSIIDRTFNQEILNEFTKTNNAKLIGVEQYDLYVHQNNSGVQGTLATTIRIQ